MLKNDIKNEEIMEDLCIGSLKFWRNANCKETKTIFKSEEIYKVKKKGKKKNRTKNEDDSTKIWKAMLQYESEDSGTDSEQEEKQSQWRCPIILDANWLRMTNCPSLSHLNQFVQKTQI